YGATRILPLVGVKSGFDKPPDLPGDVGECHEEANDERGGECHGELSGHQPVLHLHSDLFYAHRFFKAKECAQFTHGAKSEKIRLGRSEYDVIENTTIEDKREDQENDTPEQRADHVPSQLLEMIEE